MPTIVLDEAEKERVRYHTGYMAASFAAAMQFGIPRPIQTIFLLEQAMNLLNNQFAVERVRRMLVTLDDIEERLGCLVLDTTAVAKIGDMELRGADYGKTHGDLLEREYVRWARRLADHFGVPLYPYAARFRTGAGPGSIPVRH